MLPDFERAERIGEFWGQPATRSFGELLIDIEEDKGMRAVVVGMLRESERSQSEQGLGKNDFGRGLDEPAAPPPPVRGTTRRGLPSG